MSQERGSRKTNLSLREGTQEDIRNVASSAPGYHKQQRVHSIECRRLDEHGDDGPAQSTHSRKTHGHVNFPTVQDEPDDDHEGEEDIKCDRNRKVWETEVDSDSVPEIFVWLRCLVEENNTHRCINDASFEYYCLL